MEYVDQSLKDATAPLDKLFEKPLDACKDIAFPLLTILADFKDLAIMLACCASIQYMSGTSWKIAIGISFVPIVIALWCGIYQTYVYKKSKKVEIVSNALMAVAVVVAFSLLCVILRTLILTALEYDKGVVNTYFSTRKSSILGIAKIAWTVGRLIISFCGVYGKACERISQYDNFEEFSTTVGGYTVMGITKKERNDRKKLNNIAIYEVFKEFFFGVMPLISNPNNFTLLDLGFMLLQWIIPFLKYTGRRRHTILLPLIFIGLLCLSIHIRSFQISLGKLITTEANLINKNLI